jgi:hypothetical protein
MAKPINATTTYVNDTIDAALAPINERVAAIEAKLTQQVQEQQPTPQPLPTIAPPPTHAEQRESALVTAFRNLKPDIIWLKNSLDTLLKQMAAFVKAILDLTKLLSESFPIKITEEDKQKLTKAVHDACAYQLDEIKRISEENNNNYRVSMSSLDFWSMIYLLITLAMAFALTIFANVYIIQSPILAKLLWLFSAAIIIPAIGTLIYKYKRNGNR